jgi:hypothetical protein
MLKDKIKYVFGLAFCGVVIMIYSSAAFSHGVSNRSDAAVSAARIVVGFVAIIALLLVIKLFR